MNTRFLVRWLSRASPLLVLLTTIGLLPIREIHGETAVSTGPGPFVQAGSTIAAGRYLVAIGGCNDCHTAGYSDSGGNVPENDWLAGSPIGWQGPWGTTYASNLRLLVQSISEEAWVATLHTRNARPPMPWMSTHELSERDARSMYEYIRSLGPTGDLMPAGLAPDVEPVTAYVVLVPREPKVLAKTTQAETSAPHQ